ncbi:hypothetical protein [Streptacidiphilus sp. EB129]|uniref:hypothetical protein n=1 Tax=Streptacidiphilus sp. EB129 TaxID=3156262 RepID=UPI003515EF3A
MTVHVVQFSGGIGSFHVAVRVAEQVPTRDLVLLIADTKIEDPDLWRFARATSRLLGVPLTRVADGRTPWEVFRDKRFLGNDLRTPCSAVLKQIPCRRWMEQHAHPDDAVTYVGIVGTAHDRARIPAIRAGWKPWTVRFPLAEDETPASEEELREELFQGARRLGVEPPRLYTLGYEHNNCGGTCVRAGAAQWRRTLEVFPERFAQAEAEEEALRRELGQVAILTQTRSGVKRPLPLTELRRQEQRCDQRGRADRVNFPQE